MTLPELAADAFGKFLGESMQRRFGTSQTQLVEMVPSIARIAIECIGNSDALYHNVEHTMMVTLAGHDMLRGRALHSHMTAEDYAHATSTSPPAGGNGSPISTATCFAPSATSRCRGRRHKRGIPGYAQERSPSS